MMADTACQVRVFNCSSNYSEKSENTSNQREWELELIKI